MSTKIGWTQETWNPTLGCTVVSPGCANCYAMRMARRIEAMAWGRGNQALFETYSGLTRMTKKGPRWTGQVRLLKDRLEVPFRWREPRRVFVDSMSDLFHKRVPVGYVDLVFAVMAMGSQHTFQVLTKRPERMADYLRLDPDAPLADCTEARVGAACERIGLDRGEDVAAPYWDAFFDWPLRNVWLGTSVEDQKRAELRIPQLIETLATVRWLSCEPLLGPLDLRRWLPMLDWVVVGGESGPGWREADPAWISSVVQQCRAAGVPVFVKQDSAFRPETQGRIPDADWIQEYPKAA